MKDDKKKLIVIGALALVIVCVGVFQFVLSGPAAPAPAATVKKEEKKAPEQPQIEPPKNPLFVQNLSPRDPFNQPPLPQDLQKPSQPTPTPTPEPERTQPILPRVDINKTGDFNGTAPVTMPAPPESKFAFTLSGVMLGAKPMAVFTDAQGSQRLILLGGSLDPESKVISIERDAVTVRFHGKTLRLTVEGNPNGK